VAVLVVHHTLVAVVLVVTGLLFKEKILVVGHRQNLFLYFRWGHIPL
jgi:hypothetical protein